MTFIVRDRVVERDTMDRIERLSRVTGFADQVVDHLDDVEVRGGPDAPAKTAAEAARGGHEEGVDGACWGVVTLTLLADEVHEGVTDEAVADEAGILVQDAMVAFAHAENAMRGALMLLGEEP